MTNERETKRVDELRPGDVVADLNSFVDKFITIRWVEPISDDPCHCVVLLAGGETAELDCAREVQIATSDECAAHEAMARDDLKRARMIAGLMKLVAAIDDGLPLPHYFDVDGSLMPDAESVRAVAEHFGIETMENDNAGAPQIRARLVLADGEDGRKLVELDMWHLGARAAVES